MTEGVRRTAREELSELTAPVVVEWGLPMTAWGLLHLAAELYQAMGWEYEPMTRKEFLHQADSVWAITTGTATVIVTPEAKKH